MSVTRGLFVRKDSTRGTSPVEARVALAGLLTQSGDLGVTPGVLSGGGVTGKTSWAYSVAAGHFVTSRSATDGAVLLATDGATDTPTVSAAPATGSRWDLIWIRHRDVENADPDSNAVLGVTSGTSSGTPSKPYGSVPAGALVLAEAQVSAGASNTADALVTITGVAPRVAARGGIIPVASTAQQALLTAAGSAASPVYTELNGVLYKSTGSAWVPLSAGSAPSWAAPAVLASWSASTIQSASINGFAALRGYLRPSTGTIPAGNVSGSLATLPVGQRPSQNMTFDCTVWIAGGTPAYVPAGVLTVSSAGVVGIQNNHTSAVTAIQVDGINIPIG